MNYSSIQKEQNEYAKNVKGKQIFILDAESGRKGHWCIVGCEAVMEAVRRNKNLLHKSYFRHIAKDVKKGEIPAHARILSGVNLDRCGFVKQHIHIKKRDLFCLQWGTFYDYRNEYLNQENKNKIYTFLQ